MHLQCVFVFFFARFQTSLLAGLAAAVLRYSVICQHALLSMLENDWQICCMQIIVCLLSAQTRYTIVKRTFKNVLAAKLSFKQVFTKKKRQLISVRIFIQYVRSKQARIFCGAGLRLVFFGPVFCGFLLTMRRCTQLQSTYTHSTYKSTYPVYICLDAGKQKTCPAQWDVQASVCISSIHQNLFVPFDRLFPGYDVRPAPKLPVLFISHKMLHTIK